MSHNALFFRSSGTPLNSLLMFYFSSNIQKWAFLVTAALLDDLIRGCRLLFLSSTRGSTKCFISGMSLVGIIVLAIYCSFFYNQVRLLTLFWF